MVDLLLLDLRKKSQAEGTIYTNGKHAEELAQMTREAFYQCGMVTDRSCEQASPQSLAARLCHTDHLSKCAFLQLFLCLCLST